MIKKSKVKTTLDILNETCEQPQIVKGGVHLDKEWVPVEVVKKGDKKIEVYIADLHSRLSNIDKILHPQLDLLKTAQKYGTYQILLTYEQIQSLRSALIPIDSRNQDDSKVGSKE